MLHHRLARIVPFLMSLFMVVITPVDAAPPAQGTGGCAPDAIVCRVSVRSDGAQGNAYSGHYHDVSVSADGRIIAFTSDASNLVPGDTNNATDIFVHDRQTGETRRVSVSSGGGQGDESSYNPSISTDGRTVAFTSYARNLVSGDTNNATDVFVHDRQTGTTIRVSVSSVGAQGNSRSGIPALSADGRIVAFTSDASNLVPDDTNSATDVFLHDRQTGVTSRVSVSSQGAQGDSDSDYYRLSLSADGQTVAFMSAASNLVSGDVYDTWDVFVYDRQTETTNRVLVEAAHPSLSADGRFVAFTSIANDLVPGDTNNTWDVFVVDRQTGGTSRVSVSAEGTQANSRSGIPSLSADGRFVAFSSNADNLAPDDTNNTSDVFVHDRQTGTTSLVSVSAGVTQSNHDSYHPVLSANGLSVAFGSAGNNLVPGDTNNEADVFVVDWQRLPSVDMPSSLQVNIMLQGRPLPDAAQAVPLAVTITRTSDNAVIVNDTFTSDANGQFGVNDLETGTYRIRVKHALGLAASLDFTMGSGSQLITVGMLRAGDADNNNMITILDFGILAATYGTVNGDAGYDARADFNADAIINVTDFSLLATNFGQMGAP